MNIKSYSGNTAFNGRLKLAGDATENIKRAFYNNEVLQNLRKGEYDIIGRIKTREASDIEVYKKGFDDILYRFSLQAKKQHKSLIGELFGILFRKPIVRPTKNYHSEQTTVRIINNLNDENRLRKRLGI